MCTELVSGLCWSKLLTGFVLLDGFVLKVSKHDLEPVGIIGSQHPAG